MEKNNEIVQKAEDLKPKTDVQKVQKILYDLMSEHLFTIDGIELQVEGEQPELFVPKSLMVDKAIQVLNEVGEFLSDDGGKNETDVKSNQ
jgi:hypothetical protein